MASDLERWFGGLPARLERNLADEFAEFIDEEFVEPIRDAAPQGETGNTKQSVRRDPGPDVLSHVIRAGGPLTTKEVREGSGVAYDYALAQEFGTSRMAAQPFFYPTYRVRRRRFERGVADMVGRTISKL